MHKHKLHVLELSKRPIFEQLRLEEAFLRTSDLNICLINHGTPRAIVMGISGEPSSLIHGPQVKQDGVPVIRRFSGGGTVIVDEETLFITFLMNQNAVPVIPFPEPILRWTGQLYTASWQIPGFRLVENDYAIGERKCGGNAQYIKKNRWLHHTSFLWDYALQNMEYLRLPVKRPNYRADRAHSEFLCTLKSYAESKEALIASLLKELGQRFELVKMQEPSATWPPHRIASQFVEV